MEGHTAAATMAQFLVAPRPAAATTSHLPTCPKVIDEAISRHRVWGSYSGILTLPARRHIGLCRILSEPKELDMVTHPFGRGGVLASCSRGVPLKKEWPVHEHSVSLRAQFGTDRATKEASSACEWFPIPSRQFHAAGALCSALWTHLLLPLRGSIAELRLPPLPDSPGQHPSGETQEFQPGLMDGRT